MGHAELEVQVGSQNQEFDRLDLAEAALMEAAERTGGAYAPLSGADEMLRKLRARARSRRKPGAVPPSWRGTGITVTLFALVVALLSTEWILRKRVQMV